MAAHGLRYNLSWQRFCCTAISAFTSTAACSKTFADNRYSPEDFDQSLQQNGLRQISGSRTLTQRINGALSLWRKSLYLTAVQFFNFAYPKHLIILADLPKPNLDRYLTSKGRTNEKLPQKTTCLADRPSLMSVGLFSYGRTPQKSARADIQSAPKGLLRQSRQPW